MWTWSNVLLVWALRAVLWLGVLILLMGAAIVGHRLVDRNKEVGSGDSRRHYDELIALLVAGELAPLDFLRRVRRRDHRLLEDLLVEVAEKFAPDVRAPLAPVFQGIGATVRNRRRTRSRRWWHRADAARRLGLMQEETISRSLRLLLRDPQAEVRIAAARALLELGAGQWIDDVIGTLRDPDAFSSLRLADVVLQAGPGAVPGLMRFLAADPGVRGTVVALDILGDMRAVAAEELIVNAVGSPEKEIRAAACRALGRLESPAAVDVLCVALADPAWEVQNQAVRALGAIGDPAAIPLLLPMVREASVWTVYRTAAALAHMRPAGLRALQQELFRLQADEDTAGDTRTRVVQEVVSQAFAREA
jgi:HEAT repeat protein